MWLTRKSLRPPYVGTVCTPVSMKSPGSGRKGGAESIYRTGQGYQNVTLQWVNMEKKDEEPSRGARFFIFEFMMFQGELDY